jgi:periplasmic copper chaperone A
MRRPIFVLLTILLPVLAVAHISATSPGFANTTQEIVLSNSHGCEGADTYTVKTTIPAGVTSVRAINSGDFGKATVQTDATGQVTSVTWQKADADLLAGDTHYYKTAIRARLPNQPFTVIYFPTEQTCKRTDGGILVSHWTNTTSDLDGGEPAPAVTLLPARRPGWNKYTVPVAIPTLSVFFSDAQIVWKGNAAYSANPAVTELIGGTPGVTALTSLAANDEIWVKY